MGYPFHLVTIKPAILAWNNRTVVRLARDIYDQRDFYNYPARYIYDEDGNEHYERGFCNRWPILAEALLDAGCDNEEIIQHCRHPGPHVRGCWVVDLILGKE